MPIVVDYLVLFAVYTIAALPCVTSIIVSNSNNININVVLSVLIGLCFYEILRFVWHCGDKRVYVLDSYFWNNYSALSRYFAQCFVNLSVIYNVKKEHTVR